LNCELVHLANKVSVCTSNSAQIRYQIWKQWHKCMISLPFVSFLINHILKLSIIEHIECLHCPFDQPFVILFLVYFSYDLHQKRFSYSKSYFERELSRVRSVLAQLLVSRITLELSDQTLLPLVSLE
jgi:hypothetical protein